MNGTGKLSTHLVLDRNRLDHFRALATVTAVVGHRSCVHVLNGATEFQVAEREETVQLLLGQSVHFDNLELVTKQ